MHTWFPSRSILSPLQEMHPPVPMMVLGPVQPPSHTSEHGRHTPRLALLYVFEKHDLSDKKNTQ